MSPRSISDTAAQLQLVKLVNLEVQDELTGVISIAGQGVTGLSGIHAKSHRTS